MQQNFHVDRNIRPNTRTEPSRAQSSRHVRRRQGNIRPVARVGAWLAALWQHRRARGANDNEVAAQKGNVELVAVVVVVVGEMLGILILTGMRKPTPRVD